MAFPPFRALCARWFAPRTSTRRRAHLRFDPLEVRDVPATGGGYTAGGLIGEYFANADLSGTPSFTRTDVRIDFNWDGRAPGGSTSPEYAAVAADDFSVRWTGQLIPRFNQTYTFHTTSSDGIRVSIRPAGTATWVPLIDDWNTHASADDYAKYKFQAGKTYDIQIEYTESGGNAVARLQWSSPSTPQEVIDPATNLGVNAVTYDNYVYADAAKSGRVGWGDPVDYFGNPSVPTDADGYPLADAGHVFWQNQDPTKTGGTYRLSFAGQAEVTAWFGDGQFVVDGTNYGTTLPAGVGYDPTTNTTTAQVIVAGTDIFGLNFLNTQRTPDLPTDTGITNVSLMRPTAVGSTTSYQPGELFASDVKDAFSRFTTLRYLTANLNAESDWSDRMLPGAMQAAWGDRHAVWEDEVMLANETGKDLYITIPISASADYVQKLALLLKYGSDGVNPYTGPVADPVYPGLNPNLRVYVEWGNEDWNWAFPQANWGATASTNAVLNQTAEGQIINFDGKAPWGDFRRWDALKTVEASDTFRSVFGDAAMGGTVRMLLEYQYDNVQNTAVGALSFINNYFNNGDGHKHVATPHPVSYYLWGAGGASYFGASNPLGIVENITVPDGSFEAPSPANSWTFTGTVGVYQKSAGTYPTPPQGTQALYITGTGTATVTINVPKPGAYAIAFQAAAGVQNGGNPLDFYFDGQRVTPNGADLTPFQLPWVPGTGFGHDPNQFTDYGTVPVTITRAGTHTFQIAGRGTADQVTVIDRVRVSSTDALFASRIPAGGQAAGQVSRSNYQAQLVAQAKYAQKYGLKVVAYEGGWSLGGDTDSVPIQSWAKYHDPRTVPAMEQAIDAFYRAGGELDVLGTYDQWYVNDAANADTYPIVQAIDARLAQLPARPTAASPPPATPPVLVAASAPLPLGWTTEAVGSPALTGSASLIGGKWTVQGSGDNIFGTSDQFQFADRSATGDVTLVIQVSGPSATDGWAKAGLMIRAGVGDQSPFAAIFRTPDNGLEFETRDATGDTPDSTTVPVTDSPVWLKLVRQGTSFNGYFSTDGKTWSPIGDTETIAMPGAIRVGVAVTSHDPTKLATATFTKLAVVD